VVMLLLSYLPGPILPWQTLLAFDGLLVILILLVLLRPAPAPTAVPPDPALDAWPALWPAFGVPGDRRWLAAGLLILVLTAVFMRVPNLGYSEFQGDETRALLRTAEAIQGREDTLMLHKKGPAEILL